MLHVFLLNEKENLGRKDEFASSGPGPSGSHLTASRESRPVEPTIPPDAVIDFFSP